jgi:hypothetical protein
MPRYVRIAPSDPLPDISSEAPFRAVIVLDAEYSPEWQNVASDWLVEAGCLYMMAWGPNCSTWGDSMDWSNVLAFQNQEIPDEKFVMTTWHSDESLESVFWFAGAAAHHPDVELNETILIHVGQTDREVEFLNLYERAKTLPEREP